jgi:hypothetical protein
MYYRDEFEQAGISFKEHTKSEHNMWNYLWFLIYLESIDPLSYTGPEFYASKFIVDKSVSTIIIDYCLLNTYIT